MSIIFTLQINNNKFDLKVDENQKIVDTLRTLNENNIDVPNVSQIKSKNNNKYVSVFSTYRQGNIYTGDILKF